MCECMKEIDAVLRQHNGRLAVAFGVTQDLGLVGRYLMATEKIDKTKRKPVPNVMCRHCPNCGESLLGEPEASAAMKGENT